MSTPLDHTLYMRFPKLDVAAALSLAKTLRHRVPESSSPAIRSAFADVERRIHELEAAWRLQNIPRTRTDLRPLARNVAAAWRAIRDRLASYTALPEGHEDRVRALEIQQLVLHDGLAFLLLPSLRQHSHSQVRIETIDERGLADDLARLIGAPFVAVLRSAHQAYGDALGITKATPPRMPPALVAEPLRALGEAVTRYALQLLALAHADPDAHDAVVSALAPIDEYRAHATRRRTAPRDAIPPAVPLHAVA